MFDSTTKNTEYTYKASNRGSGYTTTQLDTEKLDNVSYKYYYDNVGNITSITKNSGAYRSYTYDNKNQLTKEVNSTSGITTSFTYDSLGNITKKVESGSSNKTINYRYDKNGKTGWNNLLTGVDLSGNGAYEINETISYDNIGNPTSYLGATLTWFGRQLKSYTINSQTVNYTYDADGLRSSKSVPGVNCTYQYVGGQLRYETRGNQRFYYYYDANGNLSAIRYYDANGTASIYFVLTNAQGDVKSIYSKAGALVASYEYDAFGNCTLTNHVSGENIGELNPIRYRGYYYDSETGLYYLQSRYYNPQVGRFLNADGLEYLGTGTTILCFNIYAYCLNNPITYFDKTGCAPQWWQWTISGVMFVGGIALVASGIGGILGGTLICASANSIINSYISEYTGGSSVSGWVGGMITGAFCGVGAGLAGNLLVAASESVGVTCLSNIVQSMGTAFFSGFSGAFLGECVASKIDNAPINIEKTAISSVSVGLVTCLSGVGTGIGTALASPIGTTTTTLSNTLNAVCTVMTEAFCDFWGTLVSIFT